jgi:hypothetical protein
MLKLNNFILAVVASSVFMVIPAFAQDAGCKNGKFVGSYTNVQKDQDVFGNGTVIHTWINQLNLHSDGTADLNFTAALEYPINTGSQTSYIGSWACRDDGQLVVTLIRAFYNPVGPTSNTTYADIQLGGYNRFTYLFSVVDVNTLKRLNRRIRTYGANDDPTDPNGGTLGPLNSQQIIYNRVVASDADLLAP